jgi:small conductance mechanosensitive channel
MNMDVNEVVNTVLNVGTRVALQLVGAFVLWIVGRRLIGLAMRLVSRGMTRQSIDPTLIGYVTGSLSVLLNVVLVVAILGFFGVETTSFAAVLAAGGVAIGVAWSGMLANFAAGAFLIVLRPFRVGDFVTAGGVTGTVQEIGLFGSVINTPDNVRTIIGNNKIFSDTIQNYSANPHRRVDLVAQLNHSVDHKAAIGLLKERLSKIPNVLADPAPTVEIHGGQPRRSGAVRAPELPQRSLLAGVLRYQSPDPRDVRRSRLPGAGAALRGAQSRAGYERLTVPEWAGVSCILLGRSRSQLRAPRRRLRMSARIACSGA